MSVVKLATRKINKNMDYITIDDLIEQLHIFEKQMEWSIFEILDILKQRKADSFSITKEKPFHYFYARVMEKVIILQLQTSEQETEFRLPIEAIKRPT